MGNQNTELEEKKQRLQELKESNSDSFCVSKHTSTSYMKREMEIEELEEEIAELEKQAQQSS